MKINKNNTEILKIQKNFVRDKLNIIVYEWHKIDSENVIGEGIDGHTYQGKILKTNNTIDIIVDISSGVMI